MSSLFVPTERAREAQMADAKKTCANLSRERHDAHLCEAGGGAQREYQKAEFAFSRKSTRDSNEHAASLSQWDQTYDQISAGHFSGDISQLCFGDLQIFRERTNRSVRQVGSPWKNCQIIGIPIQMSGQGVFARQPLTLGNIFTLQSKEGFSMQAPDVLDLIGLAIPDSVLKDYELGDNCPDIRRLLPSEPTILIPCRSKLEELSRCLVSILDPEQFEHNLLRYPQVQRTMHSDIIGNIIEVLQSTWPAQKPNPSFKVRCQLVNKAVEFALADSSNPPTIDEICHKLHIGRRLLNYYFQEILGMSPLQYLRSLRLNGVRRELQNPIAPNLVVSDVAARWGFGHLPRFAGEYRGLFGELPSATLKCAGLIAKPH